jgi:hypothetical protein
MRPRQRGWQGCRRGSGLSGEGFGPVDLAGEESEFVVDEMVEAGGEFGEGGAGSGRGRGRRQRGLPGERLEAEVFAGAAVVGLFFFHVEKEELGIEEAVDEFG